MMNAASCSRHPSAANCELLKREENSTFFGESYAEAYDKVMTTVPYDSWVDYLLDIADEVDCHVERLLDAACGTGTLGILALDRGLEVIGVDASNSMLERFKHKTRSHPNGIRCRIIESPLTTFEMRDHADAAVCFFDSLNYIVNENQFASALCRISNALRPGGLFVFDVNNEVAYQENLFQQSGRVCNPSGAQLNFEWLGKYCTHHSLYQLQLSFNESDSGALRFREQHIQRFYSREAIEGWLASAGFTNSRCFRAFSFDEGGPLDERWSFVATKH